jgi:hypothetical protein
VLEIYGNPFLQTFAHRFRSFLPRSLSPSRSCRVYLGSSGFEDTAGIYALASSWFRSCGCLRFMHYVVPFGPSDVALHCIRTATSSSALQLLR